LLTDDDPLWTETCTKISAII